MFWASANDNGCRFGHHCCQRMSPNSIKYKVDKKYIDFFINLLILPKPFDSGLGTNMRKAAHQLDGVDSLNPRCWRGERINKHGSGVCWLFVLLWINS
jgi:hypothetical protein